METTKEIITPEMARYYLEKNNVNQRKLNANWVNHLATAITYGHWKLTHQGIAFDVNDTLIDGQHRLAAIVKASISVEILVSVNCPPVSMSAIDLGKKRSAVDVGYVLGKKYSSRHYSCMRLMLYFACPKREKLSPHLLVELIEQHIEGIIFGIKHYKPVGLTSVKSASIDAVVARAYYHYRANPSLLKRLEDFKYVVVTGDAEGVTTARAALCLHNKIKNAKTSASGSSLQNDKFEWTQSALKRFMAYQPLSSIHKTSENVFPIPNLDNLKL